MKRIKVVLSDMHLGVGRILDGGNLNTLEEFYYDEKFAEFINYYSTGEYADYEVELIINGDFLNLISVDYKGHYLSVITEAVTLEKVKRIVRGHQVVFKALKEFAQKENHKITYVVGNHDMGMLWPSVRLYLNEVMGTSVRYKNIVYYFDGVHIEHGHMYEAANRFNPRRFFLKKNVAEPILNLPFGSYFFVEFVLKLKEENPHVDKVRPLKELIKWGLLMETWFLLKSGVRFVAFFLKSLFLSDNKFNWSAKQIFSMFFGSTIFPDLTTAARKILEDERGQYCDFWAFPCLSLSSVWPGKRVLQYGHLDGGDIFGCELFW
jgi:UDP-2,3-diacylglucosamine pyrophosphatase LpxH